jgi:hypothetical protein
MWAQYRKTLIPIQALILTVCVTLWMLKIDSRSIATVFVVMEIGSLYGASFGARWRRRLVASTDALPLGRRR